ncbi:hypothetical protein Ciccas_012927 [Cichlidogyrus casuarinus]|uniref:Uncharacterized protein n=1 Tax=Cichlidogyrus casuarinus TaxID=1844966 RepID=A0ABD2PS15_9PLAT
MGILTGGLVSYQHLDAVTTIVDEANKRLVRQRVDVYAVDRQYAVAHPQATLSRRASRDYLAYSYKSMISINLPRRDKLVPTEYNVVSTLFSGKYTSSTRGTPHMQICASFCFLSPGHE